MLNLRLENSKYGLQSIYLYEKKNINLNSQAKVKGVKTIKYFFFKNLKNQEKGVPVNYPS